MRNSELLLAILRAMFASILIASLLWLYWIFREPIAKIISFLSSKFETFTPAMLYKDEGAYIFRQVFDYIEIVTPRVWASVDALDFLLLFVFVAGSFALLQPVFFWLAKTNRKEA